MQTISNLKTLIWNIDNGTVTSLDEVRKALVGIIEEGEDF